MEHMFDGPMSTATYPAGVLRDGIDELLDTDLVGLSRAELLDLVRAVETQRRRLAAVDHVLLAELADRRVAAELCVPNLAMLLVQLLLITPGQARARVKAAADLGPRRSLTGEVMPPIFDATAAAQAAGEISLEHARVIVDAIDHLPGAMQALYDRAIEATLITHAHTLDPSRLAVAATRIHDYYDPDGSLTDDADHQRRRGGALTRNRDGSYDLHGHLAPECGAKWEPILDSLAAPRPAADGTADPRTPAQRIHDALADIPDLLDHTRMPNSGGLPVMLILTATLDDARASTGYATTGHGALIPMTKAINLAGDGSTISVTFDPHGGIHDYGHTERIVPPAMRLALIARDQGCTFPDCDRPPAWTQAHHFIAYADGGPTSLDNCGLLCGFHHREFAKRGWQGQIINGVPHWIPPAWLDPTQTPRRNRTHDPPAIG